MDATSLQSCRVAQGVRSGEGVGSLLFIALCIVGTVSGGQASRGNLAICRLRRAERCMPSVAGFQREADLVLADGSLALFGHGYWGTLQNFSRGSAGVTTESTTLANEHWWKRIQVQTGRIRGRPPSLLSVASWREVLLEWDSASTAIWPHQH